METAPFHRGLVAGTRPATTLTPVAYASMDFIGRTFSFPYFDADEIAD